MIQLPAELTRGTTWRTYAACREVDPDLFFPAGDTGQSAYQAEEAKAICRTCPVIATCLQRAMETHQQGVWGGTTEKERANIRRRQLRGITGARTRKPLPAYATDREAYESLARVVSGGHTEWTGGNEVRIAGVRRSPNQVAWRATHGSEPVGRVFIDCDHDGCVQHLADFTIRNARTQQPKADDGPDCGTRAGYRAHLARGEQTCQPCRDANADRDRLLRNTGTSRELIAA